MARPKRFSEKLVVGLTPEIKEFLQKEAEKEYFGEYNLKKVT